MSRPVEKHLSYFELLESLQSAKGCALCEMQERSTHRYMESLLYESVNDPDLRKKLLQSRGFCGRHADILLSFGDGLGVAILYQDQVEQALDLLQRLGSMSNKKLLKNACTEWEKRTSCPVCLLEDKDNALRISDLLGGLSEPDMRRALEQSPGLCFPHLLKLLMTVNDSSLRQYLIDLHHSKFSHLLDELREFCRKHDYRYSREKYGEEVDAWERAVNMLRGRK